VLNIINFNKDKKIKKDKIIIFSITNHLLLNYYKDNNVDILRFDLEEFSKSFGYKDEEHIIFNDIIPFVKNFRNSNYNINLPISIDVPLSQIYNDNSYSLEKVITFFNESNADILSINIEYNVLDLIKSLTKIRIPVIIYSKNFQGSDNIGYLKDIHSKLKEAESMGALMIILENYPVSFIQNIKSSILIPIISNEKNNNIDGYYAKFSSVFGLNNDEKSRYLNLNDLIRDGIKDCVNDNK
jgi:ketopantoate hydroxymethyltransferase